MTPVDLANDLERWSSLDATIPGVVDSVRAGLPLRRSEIERVRDKLERAGERAQFGDAVSQESLARIIAALDEMLRMLPTN